MLMIKQLFNDNKFVLIFLIRRITKMLTFRLETPADNRKTEEITREAFWNKYIPGCDEHLYMNKMRKSPVFIPELNFVVLLDQEIIGSIYFTHSRIVTKAGETIKTIIFGPVSIHPDHQKKGIGEALINYALDAAKQQGHRAVIIFGDPDYYKKFGLVCSKKYGISNEEGKFPTAMLALPLYEGALEKAEGIFINEYEYLLNEDELAEFDKQFPEKQKGFQESQKWYEQMLVSFE